MKTTRNVLTVVMIMALMAGSAHAATLTLGSRVNVSQNNANFDISVFDGAASYNDRGVGGSEPGTPTFTNTFGDGTVEGRRIAPGNAPGIGTGGELFDPPDYFIGAGATARFTVR